MNHHQPTREGRHYKRTTHSGQVEEYHDKPYPVIHAKLYDFDFDDMLVRDLKPDHVWWLHQNIIPLLLKDNACIWLRGSASRVGQRGYNWRLSQKRVNRVADYLRVWGVRDNQIQENWVGSEYSTSCDPDDPHDRAVELNCQPFIPEPVEPPKPPPQPPLPPITQSFKVRLRWDVDLSTSALSKAKKIVNWLMKIKKVQKVSKWAKAAKGIALDVIYFEIRDDKNSLSAYYLYGGLGIGASIPSEATYTPRGPWNYFQTSKPIGAWQFDGIARFTSASVGNWSHNELWLGGTPKGVKSVKLNNFKTGYTLLASASMTFFSKMFYLDTKRGPAEP